MNETPPNIWEWRSEKERADYLAWLESAYPDVAAVARRYEEGLKSAAVKSSR